MDIIEQINKEQSHIEDIRSKLIQAKKVQLHTGLADFQSPDAFGIYRHTGGKPLGIVGNKYSPLDLNLFLDSIINSITHSNIGLDLCKLSYNEYKDGSKISFEIPFQSFEIKESPMIGDVVETKLLFSTGFDGLTKTSLSYFSKRLWCTNGNSRYDKGIDVAFKNTLNAQNKVFVFCEKLLQNTEDIKNYISDLGSLVKKSITQKDVDEYFLRVFGFDRQVDEETKTQRRNTLDKINESVAIELQNTGDNLFSLLQGITRYTSREANFSQEKQMFSSLALINQNAHEVAFNFN